MFLTNVSSHLLWYDSMGSKLTLIGPIFPLISSITCLVILNTYLKILHQIFKKLINIVLIVNIVFLTITITINTFRLAKSWTSSIFQLSFLQGTNNFRKLCGSSTPWKTIPSDFPFCEICHNSCSWYYV